MNYLLPIFLILLTSVAFAGDEDITRGSCLSKPTALDYLESPQALPGSVTSNLAIYRIYMDEDTPPELVPEAPQLDPDTQQKLLNLRLATGRVVAVFVNEDNQKQTCRGTGIWISPQHVLITKEVAAPKRTHDGQQWKLNEIYIVTQNYVSSSKEKGVQLDLPDEKNGVSEASDFFVLKSKSGQQKFFAQLERPIKDSALQDGRSCALIGYPFTLPLGQYLARESTSEKTYRKIEAATGCFMERIISLGTYRRIGDKLLSHNCFSWPGMSGALLVDLEELKNSSNPVFHGVVCTSSLNEDINAAIPDD